MRAVGGHQGGQVEVPVLRVHRNERLVEQLLDLIRKMLCYNPHHRINIDEVCRKIRDIKAGGKVLLTLQTALKYNQV
jgi:hypothetical protein